MELRGGAAPDASAEQLVYDLGQFPDELPINQISKIAQSGVLENTGATRSAKGQEIYRKIRPQ
jgi:hypothetical protein